MLTESDCKIAVNARVAELVGVPLNQFNLMECKLLEALLFDASIDNTAFQCKMDAVRA